MSSKKKDYYGKEVTDAIRQACAELNVPQEQLDIEVVEIGSTGIFGLRRKKAHIRAAVKRIEPAAGRSAEPAAGVEPTGDVEPVAVSVEPAASSEPPPPPPPRPPARKKEERPVGRPRNEAPAREKPAAAAEAAVVSPAEEPVDEIPTEEEEAGEASAEAVALVQAELTTLLELMKFPSRVEVEVHGLAVVCTIHGEHEAELTGQDGKILDSLQYLLRKIVARKTEERLRVSIDVGEFRQKRIEELREKALELAALVKEDGKTQTIPGLNPSERREVHMALQEDKEIRSRSVGEGLFKKILIYKPGKGGKPGGRKKPAPRGRKGRGNGSPADENES
ncbi:Jag N-terminal domain-containing protein [Desulfoprunum benzoelyticum]|uniref:RNA-binding protein KhpB n=1 Tax=Desulfoprunum benzoelyticum TaxID=1506996 RepID=A0A840UZS3_9BACT|nr:protein jag [Desulfoprunum benzoelyticum]MBB5346959.1 spoIIIJ-associated protein [Desulfoprunum benzoelyticum]MBM9531023.1 Jag N-terminal domain-containing protein [Desulfoprunum benzoelyticum]